MVKMQEKEIELEYISRLANILVSLSNNVDTVTRISDSCNLSKSTTHRMLGALRQTNLVSFDPTTHRYYLGTLIPKLSNAIQRTHNYLLTWSISEIRRLSDVTGETVALDILIGIQCVRLYVVLSVPLFRPDVQLERASEIFVGSSAKVLLSQINDTKLEKIMKYIRTEPLTEHSVVDKNVLMSQIKEARQKEYSISENEVGINGMAVSVPIKNYTVPVSLNIFGTTTLMKPKIPFLLEELKISATRISNNVVLNVNL